MERIREHWVDTMKALLITSMVLGHTLPDGVMVVLIYAFHMPAFFFLSGYLYRPRPLKRLISSFLIPMIVFGVVNFCFFTAIHFIPQGRSLLDVLGQYVRSVLISGVTSPFTGFWFLMTLIGMRLLAGDLPFLRWTERYTWHYIVLTLATMSILPVYYPEAFDTVARFHIGKSLYCLPFFLLGMQWKRCTAQFFSWSELVYGIAFLLFISLALYNGRVDLSEGLIGRHFLLTFANALLGTMLLAYVCHACSKKENKIMTTLSEGTLLILALHIPLIIGVKFLIKKTSFIDSPLLPYVLTACAMLISYFLIRLARRYCPTILGK